MAVIKINVGTKRVSLTAYCPDDIIGLAACDYVLMRVGELFPNGIDEKELRSALIEANPAWAQVFKAIDDGWELEQNPPFAIDPRNIEAELQIVRHLRAEALGQRRPQDAMPIPRRNPQPE